MKTNFHKSIVTFSLAFTLITPTFSMALPVVTDTEATQTERVTFLGIETSRVSQALRNHIDIPEGVGLIIDHVAKDTGAAKAGLQEFDVLLKVDDQIIINQDQLSTLIKSKKAGETVKVEILRKGSKQNLKVELGEKEITTLNRRPRGMPQSKPFPSPGEWNFNFDSEEFQKRMEEFSEKAAEMGNKALQFIPEIIIEREEEDGSKRVTSLGRGPHKISIIKDGITAKMETIDGNKHYHISEGETVIYEGETPDEETLKALPEKVQSIIKQLHESKSFDWQNLEDLKKENFRVIINSGEEEASLNHTHDAERKG